MDNSLTPYGSMRISQAAQVMILIFENPRLSVDAACRQVGITRQQYAYWVRKGSDSIEAIRELIGHQQREMLVDIAVARKAGVEMLIKDAIDPLVAGKDRVVILKYLDEVQDELERIHHAKPGIEEEAVEFLRQGPILEKKRSRLAQLDLERTADGITISIYEDAMPVIDMGFINIFSSSVSAFVSA